MDLREICFAVQEIVKNTAAFIENEKEKHSNLDIEVKGRHNYVTSVDKNSERKLVSGLREILPDSGFITEEGTAHGEKGPF